MGRGGWRRGHDLCRGQSGLSVRVYNSQGSEAWGAPIPHPLASNRGCCDLFCWCNADMPKFNISSHAPTPTRCKPWIRHKISVVSIRKVQTVIQNLEKHKAGIFNAFLGEGAGDSCIWALRAYSSAKRKARVFRSLTMVFVNNVLFPTAACESSTIW